MKPDPRHRRLLVLRGSAAQTGEEALARLCQFEPSSVLWISATRPGSPGLGFELAQPRRVAGLLGRSFDALVLDGHGGLDAELLGQAHGFVRGGGAFLLRLDPLGTPQDEQVRARFAAAPYTPAQVGSRWPARVEAALSRAQHWTQAGPLTPPSPSLGPCPAALVEQATLVERLSARWRGSQPSFTALLADRGRGKSSALGLALAALGQQLEDGEEVEHGHDSEDIPQRVVVSAATRDALAELERFAGARAPHFVPFAELQRELGRHRRRGEALPYDLIIIDEAAQLPAASLRALVRGCGSAHFVFATTTHGYEGTGRGFALRFLVWLEQREALVRETLRAPVRWGAGDGLEAFVFDVLLLDAEPAELAVELARLPSLPAVAASLESDDLARDERALRELFGLLVQAHYRTTPSDLQRLLDAPNLRVHVLRLAGHIVAATLVAQEGQLDPETCADMAWGRRRIRAHALADSLVSHLSCVDAGGLDMIRSVRIAVHPQLRRRGLATQLVEHVHRSHAPALFGTLFGATPELLRFRRSVGYLVVRLSASRGARSGAPAVVMVRPRTPAAHALVAELRARFAWDLDLRLELLADQAELPPDLATELRRELPEPTALDLDACRAQVEFYARGPRTYESVALALSLFVAAHETTVASLAAPERELILRRAVDRESWEQVCEATGLHSIPATMRALRRAVRALLDQLDGS